MVDFSFLCIVLCIHMLEHPYNCDFFVCRKPIFCVDISSIYSELNLNYTLLFHHLGQIKVSLLLWLFLRGYTVLLYKMCMRNLANKLHGVVIDMLFYSPEGHPSSKEKTDL